MSETINVAVAALREKLADGFGAGSAKFELEGKGCIVIDDKGVRAADEETDVTLIASGETFQQILTGDLDPTIAFMKGALRVEGNMGIAMQLGSALS